MGTDTCQLDRESKTATEALILDRMDVKDVGSGDVLVARDYRSTAAVLREFELLLGVGDDFDKVAASVRDASEYSVGAVTNHFSSGYRGRARLLFADVGCGGGVTRVHASSKVYQI
jgi:hypothetical protein